MAITMDSPVAVQYDPLTNRDDFDLTQKLNSLYWTAKQHKMQYQASWRRNWLLTNNRQYSMDTRQPWSPNVTDSEIYPILSSRIGWMTDQNIVPTISPAATSSDKFFRHYQWLAGHLEALLQTTSILDSWETQIVLMLWDAAMFGAGILKAVWDSGLERGLGNVALKRVDAWSFYPDPNATSINDCQYMFEVRKMTVEEMERRWPDADIDAIVEAAMYGDRAGDSESRPQTSLGYAYPMAQPGNLPGSNATTWGLPGQSRREASENVLTDGVNVYECWVRENWEEDREPTDWAGSPDDDERVIYDSWRCVVYSGNVVLFDEYAIDLWENNRHPYSRYVDEEMGEFWTNPIVSHLAPCQIAINRILSSIQGNIELTGNPIFMDVDNSGLARTAIVNRPGIRLQMSSNTANSQGAKPDWLPPPPMSTDVWQGLQYWKQCMENISGLSGVSKGQQPSGRQAQQTIQSTQEAGFVRIRSSQRNLEKTLTEQYNLLAHLVVQNFDVPRVMAIVGEEGRDAAVRFAARHFYTPSPDGAVPMKFSIQCMAGSGNPTSRQARIAEADALLAMGAIDRQAVLQTHNFPHWQDIEQRMEQKEAAQMAAMAAGQMASASGKGGGPKPQPRGPGTGHEH
jgi:hypothetical protein